MGLGLELGLRQMGRKLELGLSLLLGLGPRLR